ncbi:MAG: M23 family metallopeptidase [Cyclobacteriaceae bacterium]
MRYTTYRYNPQTCQYERVKVRAKNVLWYGLGVFVLATSMLSGLLLVHDIVVNTETEKKLRKENRAFKEHHKILSSHLNELQPTLTSLQNKDQALHYKFFGSQAVVPEMNTQSISKENVLLADAAGFRSLVNLVKKTSQQLLAESSEKNRYFRSEWSIRKPKPEVMGSLPTRQPFEKWQPDMLISGFGLRINPYHKGLYEHVGIDIAVPRGTTIHATASGIIKEVKKSELQAGYGNYIEIDHSNGIVTRYAHLQDIRVGYGKKVNKGELIGTVGTSGGSIAPHLHYEILRNGENVDPIYYIIEGLSSDQHERLTSVSHQQNQSLD